MTPDPLFELIGTALELMNRPFVAPVTPQGLAFEFYHQFRKLWDRGIPVGLGLGHVLLKPVGDVLVVERIAEQGVAGENLAVIAFALPEHATAAQDRLLLTPGRYRHRVAVVAGVTDAVAEGITTLPFDPEAWRVV